MLLENCEFGNRCLRGTMNQGLGAPIYIHSLFGSGGIWLFDSFWQTEDQVFWCYQEPFHETLINLKDLQELVLGIHDDTNASLRHPSLDKPYFYEFYAIREHIGDSFQKCISFASFFDRANCAVLDEYIGRLIRYALGRPVLQCRSSFGRVKHIRQHHGGMHIYLWRNPWDQWWLYQIDDYFDIAEQTVRKPEVKQKISGCFKTFDGASAPSTRRLVQIHSGGNPAVHHGITVPVVNSYHLIEVLWEKWGLHGNKKHNRAICI
jgi:hypothetical protein